jgi:hypothetical protein
MSDDRSAITIPDDGCAAILDAVQRAIVDKYAAKATRKAAFSALLVLVEAGMIVGDTSIRSTAKNANTAATTPIKRRLQPAGVAPPNETNG